MAIALIDLMLDTTLRPVEKFVGLLLCNYADLNGGNVFPSVSTICRRTSYSRCTVKRALRRLKDIGLIKYIGPRRNRQIEYRIVLDKLRELAAALGVDLSLSGLSPYGGQSDPLKGSERPPQGVTATPNPSGSVRKKREDNSAEIMKQGTDQPVEIEPAWAPAAESPSEKKQGATRCKTRVEEQVVSHREMLRELAKKKPIRRQGLSEEEWEARRAINRAQGKEILRSTEEQRRLAQESGAAEDRAGAQQETELVPVGNSMEKKKPRESPPGTAGWRGPKQPNWVTGW